MMIFASTEILEMHPHEVGAPARITMIRKLRRAYNYLKLRNEMRRNRLRKGRTFFAMGFALLLVVILAYLVLSIPRKARPRETDNDRNGPTLIYFG
jgi:hypothetical protein